MTASPPSPVTPSPTSKKQQKLRFTCDACKDAKTRCNREVPSCYRCRNQKLQCVYNLSRRMGRPRRLKTGDQENVAGTKQKSKPGSGAASNPLGPEADANAAEAAFHPINTSTEPSEMREHPIVDEFLNHQERSTTRSLSDASVMDAVTTSSFMDGFNLHEDYDLADLDNMTDFDFLNGTSMTPTPVPASPIDVAMSLPSQTKTAPAESNLTYPLRTEQRKPAEARMTPQKSQSFLSPSVKPLNYEESIPMNSFDGKYVSDLDSASDCRLQAFGDEAHKSDRPKNLQPPLQPDGNGIELSQSQDCGCRCYEIVVRKLSDLDESQSGMLSSTIDVALMVEKGVQPQIAQVLQCGTCSSNRPNLLLLLSVIIDNIVSMLESTSNANNKLQMDGMFLGRSSHRSSQALTECNGDRPATPSVKPPLLVGGYEICSELKSRFLKQLLQGRLNSLSSTLLQLMQYMQRNPHNSNSKHGTTMVKETHKRLQSIIGRVELWDG